MKVLEIGPNIKPQAQYIPGWEHAEVITMDVDTELHPDIVNDARIMPDELAESFDGLLASHVLEHFTWFETVNVLTQWRKVLKDGGEMHIIVPSLEWCAKQILSEHPSKAVFPMLYGGITSAWDIHVAGFTMRHLRYLMDEIGMGVVAARSGLFHINVLGQTTQAEQHYIKAVKK